MANVVEKVYSALNAHDAPTTLRVHFDSTTGAVQFWVGVQQGRDYPRLAKIAAKDASDLAAWLVGYRGWEPSGSRRRS